MHFTPCCAVPDDNIRLLLRRLQRRLRRFCAFILLSILACVRLMLPDRSEMTL